MTENSSITNIEDDDPVIFEIDVYLNNATFSDIITDLAEPPNTVAIAKELCSKPFNNLLILQYPLEVSTCSDSDEEGEDSKFISALAKSNVSDRLPLKSLQVGEVVKNDDISYKKSYGSSSVNKDNRYAVCPLIRFDYDLGSPYLFNHKSATFKRVSKSLKQMSSDTRSSPKLAPLFNSNESYTNQTLTFESSIATNEYVTDCLGILNVKETEHGLERSLHVLPVKGIIQMRPKLSSLADGVVAADDDLTNLFYNKDVRWKDVNRIYYPDSAESRELLDVFSTNDDYPIKFMDDRSMYINSICSSKTNKSPFSQTPSGGLNLTFSTHSSAIQSGNQVQMYSHTHHLTPNMRFMSTLDVEMQLKLLLSQRHIDSFYSLKRDIICGDMDEIAIIDLLKKFAKSIDGNWILSSEYAIDNYTDEDDCDPNERKYLVCCRDLMIGLLSRKISQNPMFKVNSSLGSFSTEMFQIATKLPPNMMNDLLSKFAKPQGKIWILKLDRDEKFCQRYRNIVEYYQRYWDARIQETANILQSYKGGTEFSTNRMVRNFCIKSAIVSFIKNSMCTSEEVVDYLDSLGYSNTSEENCNFDSLLSQVAIPIVKGFKKYWVLKPTNVSLDKFRMVLLNGDGYESRRGLSLNDVKKTFESKGIPNFITRRIMKSTG
ncbi:hypothetical protein BEWA_034160 [Theileria equi strain WA]|uniref:Uncharacterized protein n=1 Tax=Theileria equi strain WA TaxID=1537102 RepID=L0B096_THEEQ|nr:hypothetical protein BEWA_034160 [Theileria equi strain WA]AFZ80559.1 hypothetical protein BEWA_034160 [Theileria equi strain WA]|eukprot:XP_004830225.1 hypothetical protein BEWA_034160 [Theileria equi strain WA]